MAAFYLIGSGEIRAGVARLSQSGDAGDAGDAVRGALQVESPDAGGAASPADP